MGRGVRFCAHEGMVNKTVEIIRWFLQPPPQASRDELMRFLSQTSRGVRTLAFIRGMDRMYGGVGYEYKEWDASMRAPEAVNLYNFEKLLALKSIGKAQLYRPATRFHAVAGKAC